MICRNQEISQNILTAAITGPWVLGIFTGLPITGWYQSKKTAVNAAAEYFKYKNKDRNGKTDSS